MLDASVNHGTHAADRMLQRAVGVRDDGVWGPKSEAAAKPMDNNDILMLFLAERGDYMTKCEAWPSFGRGWTRRICTNLRYAAQDN